LHFDPWGDRLNRAPFQTVVQRSKVGAPAAAYELIGAQPYAAHARRQFVLPPGLLYGVRAVKEEGSISVWVTGNPEVVHDNAVVQIVRANLAAFGRRSPLSRRQDAPEIGDLNLRPSESVEAACAQDWHDRPAHDVGACDLELQHDPISAQQDMLAPF
jgi:hypothetical protein